MPCRFSSCAKCYQAGRGLPFPVQRAYNDESKYYRRRREDEFMFMVARPGDWIIAPFQCEKCWFVNLYHRLPRQTVQDNVAQDTIRRANLDMFWSRAASTVRSTMTDVKDIIIKSQAAGRVVPF